MDKLTLIIPAKHEKESLPIVLKELISFNYKKLIILEESDLETIEAIKSFNCKIIFQKNKGYGDALTTGLNCVDTEYFCIFNADGSFNPNEIPMMFEKISTYNYDFIFASRYEKNSSSEDDTLLTKIGNYFFTFLGNLFFSLNITDVLYTFVIGKKKAAVNLNLKSKDFGFCVELPIKAKRNNYKLGTIPSNERPRIAGKKKVNEFKDGLKILFKMLSLLYFSRKYK